MVAKLSNKSYGVCHCGERIVKRDYKIKDTYNAYKTFYRCEKFIEHTHDAEQIAQIDLEHHKAETERLAKC